MFILTTTTCLILAINPQALKTCYAISAFQIRNLVVLILPSFNQTVSEVGGQVNCLGTCSIGSVPLRMMGGQE
ncbi:hypothetical protein, partial [Pseudomonas viridiflava]|uniref:hypothetical protein n=1 Tax=Pseudomonas viridiflava TaxID=33069 RepID=UPI00197EF6D0